MANYVTKAVASARSGFNNGMMARVGALTHVVNADTNEVLCSRIKRSALLDDRNECDVNGKPTCPVCAKRDPRQAAK